jgi:hypothetical protein
VAGGHVHRALEGARRGLPGRGRGGLGRDDLRQGPPRPRGALPGRRDVAQQLRGVWEGRGEEVESGPAPLAGSGAAGGSMGQRVAAQPRREEAPLGCFPCRPGSRQRSRLWGGGGGGGAASGRPLTVAVRVDPACRQAQGASRPAAAAGAGASSTARALPSGGCCPGSSGARPSAEGGSSAGTDTLAMVWPGCSSSSSPCGAPAAAQD